ncbi:hypothetical protein K6119_11245 [Paracrocinitomix mangrovi]|uniref:hypothetical protein n=1 Tax=Paracrocinitomix mangrovi TaxID=2862509 RepID=UPI001C8DDBE5|nr:hypothetical protein [Paracrocinitomix mangrovi]UKN00309.1 hypothetical protein K6119_11245 [Paracrocinitomix mangrovi]
MLALLKRYVPFARLMANCPHCGEKLGFWKVISLKPETNLIECHNCNYNLKAEIHYLYHKVLTILIVAVAGIRLSKWIKDEMIPGSNLVLILSILIFIVGLRYFYNKVTLVVYNTGEKSIGDIYQEINQTKLEAAKIKEIKKFKEQYFNMKNSELEEIATQNGWQETAKIAAQEILSARKNDT